MYDICWPITSWSMKQSNKIHQTKYHSFSMSYNCTNGQVRCVCNIIALSPLVLRSEMFDKFMTFSVTWIFDLDIQNALTLILSMCKNNHHPINTSKKCWEMVNKLILFFLESKCNKQLLMNCLYVLVATHTP